MTIRCIPSYGIAGAAAAANLVEAGKYIVCGEASQARVVFAKSY